MFKSLFGRDFQFDPASGAILVGGRPALSGVPRARGKDFYVSSLVGATGSDGRGPFSAISTIDIAIGKCTAGAGDRIICMPGHVDTVTAAAGIALDIADVEIIGLGRGAKRAKVNFTTAVGASFKVTAANCTISNILFTGGFDALTNPVHIDGPDFTMLNCETRDVTGQATDFIVTTALADRFRISGWKHLGAAAAGADTAISVVGGDDWVIEDFDLYGNFAVAGIENVTTASNRARIGSAATPNRIWTEHAADIAITMHASTTGFIVGPLNIMLQDNAANITECIVAAAMQLFLPINVCNLAGEVGMTINITASTDA